MEPISALKVTLTSGICRCEGITTCVDCGHLTDIFRVLRFMHWKNQHYCANCAALRAITATDHLYERNHTLQEQADQHIAALNKSTDSLKRRFDAAQALLDSPVPASPNMFTEPVDSQAVIAVLIGEAKALRGELHDEQDRVSRGVVLRNTLTTQIDLGASILGQLLLHIDDETPMGEVTDQIVRALGALDIGPPPRRANK